MRSHPAKKLSSYTGLIVALLVMGAGYAVSKQSSGPSVFHGNHRLNFQLTEVSKKSGVLNKHSTFFVHPSLAKMQPYLAGTSASVAVVDYDNDGWPDLYVNNSEIGSKNRLFHNNKNGTFTDLAEQVHIANVNRPYPSYRPIFFDFDNDGYKDLLLLSYCPRFFRNTGGSFSEVSNIGIECGMYAAAGALVDFNGDGYLDLVLAPYEEKDLIFSPPKDLRVLPDNFIAATNGSPIYVFENQSGKKFRRIENKLGMNHLGWHNALGTYDIRGSGRSDLWFAVEFGPEKLYFNEGKFKIRDSSPSLLRKNFSRNGMGVEIADIDNDGHPIVVTSHIYVSGQKVGGNTAWKWRKEGEFEEISRERGLNNCGWAWGAKFVDLDNDGNLDLVMGNGFISANPKKSYWYPLNTIDASDRKIVSDLNYWPAIKDASLAGYQRACIFLNLGNGHFVDVASATSMVDDLSDERAVAVVDFYNNGSQSLAIANQKQDFKLYRVDQLNKNSWIGFRLTGTRSGRDAFGTKITLTLQDGRTLSRQLQPLNGYNSQSDARLHFGLGADAIIQSMRLVWPSGREQIFNGASFAVNQYHSITEPK